MKPKEIAKRIIALMLALIMAALCMACSGDGGTSDRDDDDEEEEEVTKAKDKDKGTGKTTSGETEDDDPIENPDDPFADLNHKTNAVNTGAAADYKITDGNAYIISDILLRNDYGGRFWSLSVLVSDDFSLDSLESAGCCNETLEPIDIKLNFKLEENVLTVTLNDNEIEKAESDSFNLVLVSKALNESCEASYAFGNEESPGNKSLSLKKMTGEIVFTEKLGDFSEGYCWVNLHYNDTGYATAGVIDKEGNIILTNNDKTIYDYGEFHNGLSLIRRVTGAAPIFEYLDTNNVVVFSSENSKYHDNIVGMFPDGYIYMMKRDTDLTSDKRFYAIMDYHENFVIDWTELGDDILYNYIGDDIFLFNSYKDGDSFYDASKKAWINFNLEGVDRAYVNLSKSDYLSQSEPIIETRDDWIIFDGHDCYFYLINLGENKALQCNAMVDQTGVPAEGKLFFITTIEDGWDTNYEWDCFYYDEGTQYILEYEYADFVVPPEKIEVKHQQKYRDYPSENFIYVPHPTYYKEYTSFYDYQFSNGVMLLNIKGANGLEYYTLMDEEGENVFEPIEGKAIASIGEGKFLVEKDGERYFINEKGERLNLMQEKDIESIVSAEKYNEGFSWVTTSQFEAFMDTSGNYVFGIGDSIQTVETVSVSALVSADPK